MFFVSWYQAMFTSPGLIPKISTWEEGRFNEENDELIQKLIDNPTAKIDDATQDIIRRTMVVERKNLREITENSSLTGNQSTVIDMKEELKRKCHACMVYKPDRSHHCSVCNHCVLRMDHHW